MSSKAVSLKEVTVKNVPIRSHGDTLVYNVAAFTSASDRNMEDVLKKMPGITIDLSGQISYQGEAINKFYIEDLDLLSGRYSLATKNISPADIASVSVYENHQPKRALKDIEFSELRTIESTSFRWLLGRRSDISLGLSFESAYDRFESSLLRINDNNYNDNYGYSLLTTVKPAYQYHTEKLRLAVELPLMMRNINYKDGISNSRFTLDKPYIGLQSSLQYFFMSNFSTSLSLNHKHNLDGLTDFITNPIFTTYRTQTTIGTGRLNTSNSFTVLSATDYRNTLDGLFLSMKAFYRRDRSDVMRNRSASDKETVNSSVRRPNNTNTWNVNAYAAKTLSRPDLTLSLAGNIVSASRKMISQGVECLVKNTAYDITFDTNGSFFNNFLTSMLTFRYIKTVQSISIDNTQNEVSGSLKISVFPLKSLEVYACSDIKFNDMSGNESRTDTFIDSGLRFIGKHLELELTLKNLTNRKTCAIRTFIDDDIMTYFYSLRPAECLLTAKLKL